MRRRNFIKNAAGILVPSFFVGKSSAATFTGFIRTPSGGGGGSCNTAQDTITGTTAGAQADSLWFWQATQFTATNSATICKAILRLYKTGSPSYEIKVGIYSNSTSPDRPGSLIDDSDLVSSATLATTEGNVEFTGLNAALTSGVIYWVVYKGQANGGADRTQWAYTSIGSGTRGMLISDDGGSSWALNNDTSKHKFALFSS